MQAHATAATSGLFRAYLALVSATVVWGAAFVAARIVMETVPPLGVAGLRSLVALPFFVGMLLLPRDRRPFASTDLRSLALMGVVGIAILFPLQFAGLEATGVAVSTILVLGSSPMWVSAMAAFVLHESLTGRKIVAILLGAAGVVVVVSQGDLQLGAGLGFVLGCLMGLASSACWAVYAVVGRRVLRRHSPIAVSAAANIFGAIGILPLAYFTGSLDNFLQLGGGDWLLVLYLALGCSCLGHILYYYGLSRVEASRASVLSYLQLVVSVLAGVILLGEVITLHSVLGGAAIVASVYLTVGDNWRQGPSAPNRRPSASMSSVSLEQ